MDRFEQAGKAFAELCRTMATLRAPGGCDWDREQTCETLKKYLIEEAYELLEAIGDDSAHREELGDVLLQVVFQSQIAFDEQRFEISEVIADIDEKLKRRHPHVFGDAEKPVDNAAAWTQWERLKAEEKSERTGIFEGIPTALPGLQLAEKYGKRASRLGLDWEASADVLDKVAEEAQELEEARSESEARATEELGDLLFTLAQWARKSGLDAELALRGAARKFRGRVEKIAPDLRTDPPPSADELDRLWAKSKT